MNSLSSVGETLPLPTGFFRFAVVWQDGAKKRQQGIFVGMYRLLKSQDLTYDDERVLRDLKQWFNRNLHAPKRLDKDAAIFWFKPNVAGETELWNQAVALAALLEKYGDRLEIISTLRPGKVVYDDAVQIAAVPFNDTF